MRSAPTTTGGLVVLTVAEVEALARVGVSEDVLNEGGTMSEKREKLIDEAVDAIAGGTITVPGGYGELQRDDAENIVDALMPILAAPLEVDEAKLAGVIEKAMIEAWSDAEEHAKLPGIAARAVAEYLRGER